MSEGADTEAADLVGPGLVERGAARARLALPRLGPRTSAFLFAAVTWVPLALLAGLAGQLSGPGLSLAHDLATYVRFLWVGPMLLAAGAPVDHELAEAVHSWRTSPIVTDGHRRIFDRFLARLHALRRSFLPGVLLLVLAYLLAGLALRARLRAPVESWMFARGSPGTLSPAGWWCVLVSVPLLIHVVLRWVWRFGVWVAALVRLATLPVPILGTHPDGAGGLDRIARLHNLFAWLVLALSSFAAGGLANLSLHHGDGADALRRTAVLIGVLLLVLFLAPLALFTPRLIAGKRRTLARYGAVAAHHALRLEADVERALRDGNPKDLLPDDLLENDANLAQSFATCLTMRVLLIDRTNALLFAAVTALPLLLVELTRMPVSHLLAALKNAFM